MHDLVGAYERLTSVYRKYIESAFPLRYPNMAEERKTLYSSSEVLSQLPLLEPTPVYPSSGLTLADAVSRLPAEYSDLPSFAQGLLANPATRLWKHQWTSLRTVLQDGNDLVVTTGTGSGKTECFLLPVLAELAKESARWPDSPPPPANRRWWEDDTSVWKSQWAHTGRNAQGSHALRAIVLYPLNALVEDQLRRLRQTLDSDDVLRWLDENRGGNRITFGRYTGATPVSGVAGNKSAVQRLRERLMGMAAESDAVRADVDLSSEVRYYFPNSDGGEMWSRWDMQDTPPDILITNYHMLNIMLMRQVEAGMFEHTKEWLKSDQKNKFFLIVDELHSYRGTAGTEVAYILRLLLNRLGLSAVSDQLVILATSASITDTPKSRQFLSEFFGRDRFKIVSEDQEPPKKDSHKSIRQFWNAFEEFAQKVQPDVLSPMCPPDPETPESNRAMAELAEALGHEGQGGDEAKYDLAEALLNIQADHAIREACLVASGHRDVRATRLRDVDQALFGQTDADDTASNATRGLLLALGMSRRESDGTSPQPIRAHMFFHNVQNMWVCANPDCDGPLHRRVMQSPGNASGASGPVGALHVQHRITCSCGGRVLDLLVCEVCGDIVLGGYRGKATVSGQPIEILAADRPNLADMPNRVSAGQKYGQYAVFWPLGKDEPNGEPEDLEFVYGGIRRRWMRASLNVRSGVLDRSATRAGNGKLEGWTYVVGGEDADQQAALPPKCPRCDADYRGRAFDTPLRLHRTGFQKACQVVAGALARETPLEQHGKPARKLLIFTDSRQDAAKLASGMEQDHYRDMVRILMLKALDEYWNSFEAAMRTVATRMPQECLRLVNLNPALSRVISKPSSSSDAQLAVQFQSSSAGLYQELFNWLLDLPTVNPASLEAMKSMIKDYPGRVPLTAIRDRVKQGFLRIGLNPGGNGYRQNYYSVPVGNGEERHRWSECYDWSQPIPQLRPGLPPQAGRLLDVVDTALMSELMFTLFQHSVRTLESLGTGWVTYIPYGSPSEAVIGATETIIRLLGIRWRHKYSDRFRAGSETGFSRFLEKFLDDAEVAPDLVKEQFLGANIAAGGESYLGLDPDNLYVVRRRNNGDKEGTSGWRCPICSAFFLHATGQRSVCPNCRDTQLVQSVTQQNLDYYAYLAEQSGPAFRLHCEELTGQTDDGDRPRRQRWFQEVFIGDEKALAPVEGIDLLSVTTTMESGVDIGVLEAVMMANMPPRRFNYQQRVGRAGRRGVGVSLAVTFCRGRSHDDYYYERPEQITGEPPPPPYVDISSRAIFTRVFVKEVLRLAFSSLGEGKTGGFNESVHGEFGLAEEWTDRVDEISRWINASTNQDSIDAVLDALRIGTVWSEDKDDMFCGEMVDYARGPLIDAISDIASNSSYHQEALSDRLAHAGLLPMFGFPTDGRLLFTDVPRGANPWPPPHGNIDRDLFIAISQFAPGSQTVKDKTIHNACGIAEFFPMGKRVHNRSGFVPPLPGANPNLLGICRACQSVQFGEEMVDGSHCQVCGRAEVGVLDAREPKGFFTDFTPEDYHGVFEWAPRSTVPTLAWDGGPDYETDIANCEVSAFPGEILSVNSNDNEGGFMFQRAKIKDRREWREAYAVAPGPGKDYRVSVYGDTHKIALLSRRKTDVLLAGLNRWPVGVFADPLNPVGRAAWYSFAFFMRTASAAVMDVDTLEFNAGFRPTRELDGRVVGQAFLSDTLQNGAGYCWWLGQPDNFSRLLREGDVGQFASSAKKWITSPHGEECDTSCNRCLRDFYNLSYHGLLDWRLAIDMVRLALDPSTVVDLVTPWASHDNPWQLLCSGINSPVAAMLENLGYATTTGLGDLQAYQHVGLGRVSIIRHPLWTDDHPAYQVARAEARSRFPNCAVDAVTPFEIIRHPASVLAAEQ